MRRLSPIVMFAFFVVVLASLSTRAVSAQVADSPPPDLTRQPTLYVVGYAHLDTEWRWEYPRTIGEYIPNTMHDNFALFESYPHYIFSFSGANRYRMMKEYYPADYEKVKAYVKAGRWFPSGSSMEESDVNSLSAESIARQVLYGSNYFRRELGRTSSEYMLPDCFGFPASLPSILAHMGIKGFSTQKLTWHSATRVGGEGSPENTPIGIPFNVGFWEGPDGKGIIAALNPGSYDGDIKYDLSKSDPSAKSRSYVDWPARVQRNGAVSGLFTDYHYYGTGDIGGSPREPSVKLLEAIVTKSTTALPRPRIAGQKDAPSAEDVQVGDGPLRVISATAEQMFLDIKPEQTGRLPWYAGDLELIEHSAGSLTSQAYHKRWNRKNELLGDAAEKASVAAAWLGSREYPIRRLNDAWTLVMSGQFHDNQAGTSTPKAYEYTWNDDVLAMNQFAAVLTSAAEGVSAALDTHASGVPIVVYNPLSIDRQDIVEAVVDFAEGAPKAVRVTGPDGKDVPAQLAEGKVVFLATVPSVGFATYDVQPATSSTRASSLAITESSLENARYRVQVNGDGDVSSIFDKALKKELLASPARLALQTEKPHDWPAWNMDWADQKKPPRGYVHGPAKVRIVETGPARVSLEITRETEGSKFVQTVRLSAGEAGNRIEFDDAIEWKSEAAALKAVFPLTASNPRATYNWDVGTIERGNNDEKKYEVASHQWFDLTHGDGSYGVTILSDCKFGSDKPDDNTLRLTLIYTPGLGGGNGRAYSDQTTQDWGHHRFVYGVAGHAGDWRKEQTDWQALRLNQPLIAFQPSKHAGYLGKLFSLVRLSNDRVRLMALKKAEESDEVVVRFVEVDGRVAKDVHVRFAGPVVAARELNGQEQAIGLASPNNGELLASFGPYQMRTFAVKLGASPARVAPPAAQKVALPFDRAVATTDGSKAAPGFDAAGRSLPAEMLPEDLAYAGIQFKLTPAAAEKPNAVVARGQTISLPDGQRRLYVLTASADGDRKARFRTGDRVVEINVQQWNGYIGQWDNRSWTKKEELLPPREDAPPDAPVRRRASLEFAGLTPGFIKRAPVAWFASHHHTREGANEPYAYSYLFAYTIELPEGVRTITLPDDDRLRILAMTTSDEGPPLRPVQPLYDTLEP